MRNTLRAVVSLVCLAVMSTTIGAQELPKTGNITVHSGWKSISKLLKLQKGAPMDSEAFGVSCSMTRDLGRFILGQWYAPTR